MKNKLLALRFTTALIISFLTTTAQSIKQYNVYKLEKSIGKEVVRFSTPGDLTDLSTQIETKDRGTVMKLSASISFTTGGIKYSSKGNTSRFKTESIDTTVTIKNGFPLTNNGSIALRKSLIDFWKQQGKPQFIINALTGAKISIELLDFENNQLEGSKLNVYKINSGLDELLWLDAQNNAVFLSYCDSEGDKREVIDAKYERFFSDLNQKSNSVLLNTVLSNKSLKGQQHKVIAITGGNIIDVVDNGNVITNSLLVLKDGKISYVGVYDKSAIPANAKLIDATGKYIIPGLWNMHAHLFHPEYLKKELLSGVTSVRDMGNEFDNSVLLLKQANSPDSFIPHVYSAGLIDGKSENSLGTVFASSKQEIEKNIKRYYDAGFNQIKVYTYVKKNDFNTIVKEASKYNMPVVGHLPFGYTLSSFINNGMNSISHVHYFMNSLKWGGNLKEDNKSLLETLLSQRIYVDPTLNVYNLTGDVKLPYYSKIVKLLFDYGIPIVAGTDNEGTIADELNNYVNAGMSPLQAIRSATIVPATVMKTHTLAGSIEKGKQSDVVILNANPLLDIRNLKQINTVVKGEWVINPN
ncbi:amidohydrolase family protein [Mucilaginibacter aquatilis]|uniref:Amidohydrolase family protein n=1 Tax=Mucilaginibacter aquatilis TaxID=1517760 RepID=A0A6I4IQV0_9SPHI|nr:amidohydrolase family protein [Mucilaginibacter aquatilis]MVN91774.1 amidohydrolase family protein [Mucilaginibacter aquatilis]